MRTEFSERSRALLGEDAYTRLRASQVAVVGVGGVGGWCAEALARSGVGRLILVDDDVVAASNVNRQCCALSDTVGRPKVEALRARLLAIDPSLDVVALRRRWTETTVPAELPFETGRPAALVDAIDSVACKAQLLLSATAAGLPVFSSLGAAKRLDPTRVRLMRFSKVSGDGLARALRQRFKKLGRFPSCDFPCAVSSEPPVACEGLGSLMPVSATFGLVLASAVISRVSDGASALAFAQVMC